MRRCDCGYGPGYFCVCRSDRLAGRSADTYAYANVDANIINLNQHYDDGNPYDSQFDSLRTASGFLH